jgi:hypothetical protein
VLCHREAPCSLELLTPWRRALTFERGLDHNASRVPRVALQFSPEHRRHLSHPAQCSYLQRLGAGVDRTLHLHCRHTEHTSKELLADSELSLISLRRMLL